MNKTKIAGAIAALALAAPLAWEIAAPAYRHQHGCIKFYGEWWGDPDFDSQWVCPYDVNRMADIDYLRRVVLKVKNWNDLARVMQERKPKLSPAPKKVEAPEPEKKAESFDSLLSNLGKNPAITDPPKPLPETPKRQPIPATQVCGPDHWQKDHWEPSCK